ncbi:hypothetical protein EZ444_05705 [Pedobacter hiemivivus]|uniref:Uncharacterized protein n=2 Tax=Pedobacter hiemivivus TaxID=2530454 RepID=A0A4R0NEB7_9SPHI|nr:hypothetical protein EZ444_05705 [Pedobacter hiemivivus]
MGKNLKNNLKLRRQGQSFKNYVAQIKAKRMADKMYIDNLIMQLAHAKAVSLPPSNDLIEIKEMMKTLTVDLKPTIKFFAQPAIEPKQRISKKERERLDFEAYEKRLELKALTYIKNGGK